MESKIYPTRAADSIPSSRSSERRIVSVAEMSSATHVPAIDAASGRPESESRPSSRSSGTTSAVGKDKLPALMAAIGIHDSLDLARARLAVPTSASRSEPNRMSEEERTLAIQRRKQQIALTVKAIRDSSHINVAFLLDCTGSMAPYIKKVTADISLLVDRLQRQFQNAAVRVAFIRYTDFDQPANTRTSVLNFTSDISQFRKFVGSITAAGGGDGPEDIFGGLQATINQLSWPQTGTNVLLHLADAPCHGTEYHDDPSDNYPKGDPTGLEIRDLMSSLCQKRIIYNFGVINDRSTAKMLKKFRQVLFDVSSNQSELLIFDAGDLAKLMDGVYDSISASVSITRDATVIAALGKSTAIRPYTIDKTIPIWHSMKATNVELISATLPADVTAMLSPLDIEKRSRSYKIAPNPFAEGALRLAYHAQNVSFHRFDAPSSAGSHERHGSTSKPVSSDLYVFKQFKRVDAGQNSLKRYLETLVVQTVSAKFSQLFHEELDKHRFSTTKFKFVMVKVAELKPTTSSAKPQYYSVEPFVDGSYEKFNNNSGWVKSGPFSDCMQAFSHWTWDVSGGRLLVVDLQGVKTGDRILMTDPAVHSTMELSHFGKTDLGHEGMALFFSTHECNDICRLMTLKKYNSSLSSYPSRDW